MYTRKGNTNTVCNQGVVLILSQSSVIGAISRNGMSVSEKIIFVPFFSQMQIFENAIIEIENDKLVARTYSNTRG